MRARDYFPLGIASNNAFCNRTDETNILLDNIKHGKHSLLIATRRYGKSSLALRAIQLSGQPYIETDFYMASNEKVIETYILNGIVEIIGKALGPVDKLTATIKKYVKALKPKLTIGGDHFKLELSTETTSDPASNVKEGLLLLEKLLQEKKKNAIYLMDEFQTVGIISQGKGIEAAIRHVAQKTTHLTIIFSGSNRRLLKTMFENENRPLYKLCWTLSLKRILSEHYKKHLQHAFKGFWHQTVSDEALNTIILLSERHPFYINKLCDRLLTYFIKKPPTINEITATWNDILVEEKSDAVKEISLLSLGQKNVALSIAKNNVEKLTTKQNMMALQMTSSSIMTALVGLEEKDIIEKEEGQYRIINPVVRHFILKSDSHI